MKKQEPGRLPPEVIVALAAGARARQSAATRKREEADAGDAAPRAELPPLDEPRTEDPRLERPAAPPPVVEEPVADEPVAEEPVAEEPVAEEPVAEEPVADGPVVEEPVAEEPVVDGPVVDGPVVDGPVAEESVADGPVAEESVVDGPVVEEPVVEEPVADGPVVDGPVVEEPVVDGPVGATAVGAADVAQGADDTTTASRREAGPADDTEAVRQVTPPAGGEGLGHPSHEDGHEHGDRDVAMSRLDDTSVDRRPDVPARHGAAEDAAPGGTAAVAGAALVGAGVAGAGATNDDDEEGDSPSDSRGLLARLFGGREQEPEASRDDGLVQDADADANAHADAHADADADADAETRGASVHTDSGEGDEAPEGPGLIARLFGSREDHDADEPDPGRQDEPDRPHDHQSEQQVQQLQDAGQHDGLDQDTDPGPRDASSPTDVEESDDRPETPGLLARLFGSRMDQDTDRPDHEDEWDRGHEQDDEQVRRHGEQDYEQVRRHGDQDDQQRPGRLVAATAHSPARQDEEHSGTERRRRVSARDAAVVASLLVVFLLTAVLVRQALQEPSPTTTEREVGARIPTPPEAAPEAGSYVESRITADGDLRVRQWVRSPEPLFAVRLEMPAVPGGERVPRASSVVVLGDQALLNQPASVGSSGQRLFFSAPPKLLYLSYSLKGAVDMSPSVPGRALAQATAMHIDYSPLAGPTRVTLVGGKVLSMACADSPGAAPQPCGKPGKDRWSVLLKGKNRSDTVVAQVDLRK